MKKLSLAIILLMLGGWFTANIALAQISGVGRAANSVQSQCPKTAQGCTQLIVQIPGTPLAVTNPAQYIIGVYKFALAGGGLLAMLIIVFAAVERIVSAGNPSKIDDANDRIKNAIWGLALLFGAFLILNTINPNLVALSLPTLQPVTVSLDQAAQAVKDTNAAAGQAANLQSQTLQDLAQARKSGDPVAVAEAAVKNAEANVLADQTDQKHLIALVVQESNRCENYQQYVSQGRIDSNTNQQSYCDAWDADLKILNDLRKKIQLDQQALDQARENLSHLTS